MKTFLVIMRFISIVLLLLCVAVACRSIKQSTSNLPLLNTKWEAEEVNGAPVQLENNSAYFILQSGEDTRMIGHTSCNGISANYKLANDTLEFSDMMSTRRGCMGNSIESEFMSVLSRTTNYRIVKSKLILTDGQTTIAVFKNAE